MHLVSFSVAGSKSRPGVLLEKEGSVIDLSQSYADTLAVIAAGVTTVENSGVFTRFKVGDIHLHAPLSNPPRVFAIGLNYRDHAVESKMALPSVPVVFFKMPTAIVGPGDAVVAVDGVNPVEQRNFQPRLERPGLKLVARFQPGLGRVFGRLGIAPAQDRAESVLLHVRMVGDGLQIGLHHLADFLVQSHLREKFSRLQVVVGRRRPSPDDG